jgi:hypothetical protein
MDQKQQQAGGAATIERVGTEDAFKTARQVLAKLDSKRPPGKDHDVLTQAIFIVEEEARANGYSIAGDGSSPGWGSQESPANQQGGR